MKKLYIDGLFYKGSGIGRYYESLIKGLSEKFKIITCVPIKYKEEFKKEFQNYNIDSIFVDYEKFSLKGLFIHYKILNTIKADLFFFPHINIPFLFKHKSIILTIHDMRPYTQFWDRNSIKRSIIKFMYKNSINKSKNIIAISETTKKDLLNYFNVEDVKVIYNFVEEKFFKYSPSEKIIKENYILYIGNRKKHKNLERLILAYDKIKHQINHKLVIAGRKDIKEDFIDDLIKKLDLQNFIIEIKSPTDKQILNLYYYADLFVFPSLYEGFGYPPLEALALNTPTITSNIDVLKEILGEKIACFNPYSIDDISNKILNVLNNENLKKELLQIGQDRLENYRKDKIIKQYINIFEKEIK